MGTLTSCIAKFGKNINKDDKAEILRLASELRSQGMSNADAAVAAAEQQLAELQLMRKNLQDSSETARKTPANLATHADPGQAPEPATPAVVKESLTVAASNEDRKPSAMKAELLGMIDEQLAQAPDHGDFLESVKLMGQKDAVAAWTTTSSAKMGERYAPADYSRKMVVFNVKGDGKFTVHNTVRSLLTFRKAVEASGGFKDRQGKPALSRSGSEAGSGSKQAAFNNMVDDGDLEAASDYADAVGMDMDPKSANSAKVLQWREQRDAKAEVAEINEVWDSAAGVPTTTDAQREQAASHAKDLGGRVVWQRGELALIEGFSLLSGDSVYVAANGDKRTRVDIQNYTGDGYTDTEKVELLKARADAVRLADEALARNPDGPFSAGALVFADDIPAAVQGVVRGWIGLLGLDSARIVVTTPKSGAAMAENLAGRFRRIGKASLSGNDTNGTMQPLGDGDFHIAVRPSVSTLKQLEVLAHELGHVVERLAFAQADAGTQRSIREAHANWLKQNGGGRALDMAQAMRAYRSGQTTGFSKDAKAMEAGHYWRSFGEWFADQVSRWATTQDRPVGVVEQFFKRLADRLRSFFTGERAGFKSDATVAQWLDSLAKDVPPGREVAAEPGAAPNIETSKALFAGEVRTEDGKVFKPSENKLVGSAPSVRSREVSKPAKVGEYPVFVEQGGSYRMFTYSKKIAEIGQSAQQSPVGAQYSNQPTEQSASERPDLGKQWDALDQDGRHTVAALAGWATSSGKVNPQGKAISRKTWADQIETTRARLAGALEKGKEPSQANVKPAADRLEQEAQLWAKLTDGAATVAEFKAGFEAWVRDKTAIIEQFNKMTKAQLLAMGGGQFAYRYKTGNKPEIAAALWADGLAQYGLGRTISYSMGQGRNGYQDAVAKMVDATSDEQLKAYAEERKQAMKEAGERAAKVAEATQDPKTLDDFHIFLRAAMRDGKTLKDARLGMTPEQRAKFDELSAESTREQREARKRALKTELKTSSEAVGSQVVETTHTQKGHALFVVQLEKRIDRADYDRINASAKKLGGFYSSFRGRGAVPGFQFRERASADAFLKLAAGDATEATAIADQRRDAFEDDRSQSAAERLNEMADKLGADASASMAVERKQNTARRAQFAAAAERVAGRQKALAATMRSLASAISEGRAKFLDAVRQKVQVEFLERAAMTAKDAELRTKYPSYSEQQRHAGEPATAETADFAEFPSYTAMRSDLARLGRYLLEVDGTKKLGQRLMSVADDVTDSFKAWAKEGANLLRLMAFSEKGTGKAAEFATEKAAEDAIARSGYKGRAIPWQIKRGQWTVIFSPSEAMQRGVWQGDGDKQITLSPEFGAELVEQIGKAVRRGGRVSVPWQFELTYSRRKALARMGLETPAEYRSALREFMGLRQTPEAPSKLKELERAMAGRRNDGLDFFPTPAETVDAMIDAAEIEPGMRVLEPSAGWGHIAERLAAAGTSPEVIELSTDRRELLAANGFNVVGGDFMEFTDANHAERGFTFGDVMEAPDGARGVLRGSGGLGSSRVALVSDDANGRTLGHFDFTDLVGVERRGAGSGYDRILMNPPFSDRRDAAHVQHAYSLLKPGGRLVAIMGEGVFFGQDKKAQAFRDWLENVGGTSEKLAEGTFNDPSLPVSTNANARMVVVEKPVPMLASRDADAYVPAATGAKASMRQIEAFARTASAGWVGGPAGGVKVVQNADRLPEHLRAWVASADADGVAMGFYYPDDESVYLIADRIDSIQQAQFVLFHEVYGHHGLRAVLGGEYASAMANMARFNPKLGEMADGWMSQYGEQEIKARMDAGLAPEQAKRDVRLLATEEALSDWAGTNPTISRLNFLVARIQRGLRAIGLGAIADWLEKRTDAEVLDLLARARSAVNSGGMKNENSNGNYRKPAASQKPFDLDLLDFTLEFTDSDVVNFKAESQESKKYIDDVTLNPRKFSFKTPDKNLEQRSAISFGDFKKSFEGVNVNFEKTDEKLSELHKITKGRVNGRELAVSLVGDERLPTHWWFGDFDKTTLTVAGYNFEFEGAKFKRIERTFDFDDYSVKHSFLVLDDENTRASAVKKLFSLAIPEYKRIGVEKIKLFANITIGGYAWARYGFAPDEPRNVVRQIDEKLYDKDIQKIYDGMNDPAAAKQLAEFIDFYEENKEDPELLNKLINIHTPELNSEFKRAFGEKIDSPMKYLLLGTGWSGSLNLNDKTSYERLIRYLYKNTGIVFSRPAAAASIIPQSIQQNLADIAGDAGAKMNWWHKTIGTQWHKAQAFPETFGRVFHAVQDYYESVSRLATEAADQAPDILPKMDRVRDLFRGGLPGLLRNGLSAADARALAGPVFEGTLSWRRDADGALVRMGEAEGVDGAGVVFADEELRDTFNLNTAQIGHYRQVRNAIDTSLDQAVAADVLRYMGDATTPEMKRLAQTDRQRLRKELADALNERVQGLAATLTELQDEITALEDAGEFDDRINALKDRKKKGDKDLVAAKQDRDLVAEKYQRIDELKAKGYAPLMRFGKFAVNVAGPDGNSLFFGLYENRIDANRAAREMREQFAGTQGAEVTQGMLSQKEHELFAGVPIEAMELFAGEFGAADDAVYQAWLKLAKNNRSALKRLIHRKGVAGFSEDASRVLAAFITSNSRLAGRALELGGAEKVIRDIKDGDVKDEAIELLNVVNNPQETSPIGKGLLFANFIGGSIASAVVNLTQPITMTLPYLSQWGGGAAASRRLAAAAASVASGRIPEHLRAALKRAEDEGVVAPQEIHHLMAQASGSWGVPGGGAVQAGLQKLALLWGGPFSLAEQFNRRTTFLAAYETALAAQMSNPFGFAESAVLETQGLYNKGNAANWARNPVGALVLTFKQFSVHYLEWLARMARTGPQGRKGALMALALLAGAGGADGLPFAEDINDLVDTIAQALGYDFSAKRAKREFIADTLGLGDEAANVVMRGFSAVPGVPMDLSLRMGMGNLVPATGLLLASNTDRSRDVLEVAGAAGGLVKQYIGAAEKAVAGDVAGAGVAVLPMAVQNLLKGFDMAESGQYRDARGRNVSEVDELDALMKGIGFQPQSIAERSARIGEVQRSIDLAKKVEGDIVGKIARANIDGKPEDAAEARRELAQWNERNPGARIAITPAQVAKRAREMRTTREERFIKSASREMRGMAAEAVK